MALEEELKGPYFVLCLNYYYFGLLDSFVSVFFLISLIFFFFLFEIQGKPRRLKLFCKEEAKDTGCCRGRSVPRKTHLV